MKYNYFYKITNNINSKFYYGVHSTLNLNDNYMGSGKALKGSIKKYGKENFSKEILLFFKTYEELLSYEAFIVNEDMVKDPMCYNMKLGGEGGFYKHSEETKLKMKISRTGYTISDQIKEKIKNSNKGKSRSVETRQKISESKLKMTDETKKKIGDRTRGIVYSNEDRIRLYSSRMGKRKIKSLI